MYKRQVKHNMALDGPYFGVDRLTGRGKLRKRASKREEGRVAESAEK